MLVSRCHTASASAARCRPAGLPRRRAPVTTSSTTLSKAAIRATPRTAPAPRSQPLPVVLPPHVKVEVLAAVAAVQLALAPLATADETLPPEMLNVMQAFLLEIESLGPAGAVVFVLVVMLAEMVPLLPTQPLSLAAGLLFGPVKGTALVLTGLVLAAFNAFTISKGVGRPLAERVIQREMGDGHDASGAVAAKMAEVEAVIKTGGFWKQLSAVTLLRLTPIVPFSASNYVLGLMPLQLPAYLGGTALGMLVWSALYTSLGGASRKLLERGISMRVIFDDLAERAGAASKPIAAVGLVAAVAVVTAVVISSRQQQQGGQQAPASSSNGAAVGSSGNGNGHGNGSGNGNGSGGPMAAAAAGQGGVVDVVGEVVVLEHEREEVTVSQGR